MPATTDEAEAFSGKLVHLSGAEAAQLVELYLRADQSASTFFEKIMPLEQFGEVLRDVYGDLQDLGTFIAMETPPGTPSWIDDDLLKETVFTLSPRYPKPVSGGAAVEMIERVGRLGDVLQGGAA